jgi:transcriptional regulator with XRE-family HTH domain
MIRLTHERKLRGLTQDALGRRSGVHATTISLIESGRYKPGPKQLEKLRRALGIAREDATRLLEPIPVEPLGLRCAA